MPDTDKNAYLLRVAEGRDAHLRTELLRRFHGPAQPAEPRRTVAELLDAATDRRRHRAEADRRERAAAELRRAAKAARAREQHLTTLAAD